MRVCSYNEENADGLKALIRQFDMETDGLFEYSEPHFFKSMHSLIDEELAEILVCEHEGNVVGTIAFLTTPGLLNNINTCSQLIWYVKPEYRNTLCAGLLYRKMIKIAKDRGCSRLVMGLHSGNKELSYTYRRAGMIQVETQYKLEI